MAVTTTTVTVPRKLLTALRTAEAADLTGSLTLHFRNGELMVITTQVHDQLDGLDRADRVAVE